MTDIAHPTAPADLLALRKQLMRRRLSEQGLATDVRRTPERRVVGHRHPLSDGQRRMWFLQTRDPEDTTLNICVAYRLTGDLDIDRLRTAFDAVVMRHEILRTTYHLDPDGEPYQLARDTAAVPWQAHDLTEVPERSCGRRLEVLARRDYTRPFDLTCDVPVRVSVVRLDADDHVLLLTVHHICFDDESWSVLFADVEAAYRDARSAETTSDTTALHRQYVDVAVLDRAGSAARNTGVDYWRDLLNPLPEPLNLAARATAVHRSKRSEHHSRALPAGLLEQITSLARDHSSTTFMVLLAAFDALIHRYTGSDDFLVSVPVTNRRGADAESMIGYFGNTLLMRATLAAADSFDDVVANIRTTVLEGFAHQDVGIDAVIRAVNPERIGGRDGLEQLVTLSFSSRTDATGFDLDGIVSAIEPLGRSVGQEPLAFTVVFDGTGAGARIEAEFMVELLDGRIVEQMVDNYVAVLAAVVDDSSRRIADIDILGPAGRVELLAASRGRQEPPSRDLLHAVIERSARRTPDRVALATDDLDITYGEMNARANRLARHLVATGVGPDNVVALALTSSVEFVVAALAVMKAGGAYLPIDPGYPADRIDYLLADAAPASTLDLDAVRTAEIACAPASSDDLTDAERVAALKPDHLAYVIYTSGSTGRPKGVPVSHAAISDHLAGFDAAGSMTADDCLLQTSSVSFDASMFEIFSTLALGARLVIPRIAGFGDIGYVAELVTRKQVTALHMVPSMLSTFLLLPEVSEWRMLDHVIVGGEALSGEVADKFATIFDATLRNNYGPTEAVVASTNFAVDGPQGSRIVPIGAANRNVSILLLDGMLNLVPRGVVGEIYIGGVQLARGYLNRPALTAQRFVADPFGSGERLYRTGDLAMRNSLDEIEFVGRIDEQVKVRGHRIELGEVSAALTAHPAVAHAVVIATERASVGTMLVAYVIGVPGSGPIDIDDVRGHAATILPDHMVPSAFAQIDEVPLTTHGKLDRRALPEPTMQIERAYREPFTATEVALSVMFGQIFARETVGADDSFFDLGGHSLLATRLIAQIRAEFGVDLDIRVPFDSPTVSEIAALIDARAVGQGSRGSTVPAPPAMVRRRRPDRVPLSYSQLAMWFQRRFEGASAVGNIPLAARIDGPLDIEAFRAAITDVIARHASLRTTFPEADGVPHQLVNPAAPLDIPVIDLRRTDPAGLDGRVEAELAAQAVYEFAVESELLIRPRIITRADDHHIVSLLVHHLVADHWSVRTLFTDLVAAYRARVATGVAPQWAPSEIEYTDYALWQREIFDATAVSATTTGDISEYGRSQIDYWRAALAGLPNEISVAHDRPRPPVLGKRGEVIEFAIAATLRAELAALAEASGATEFMVCQAAVSTLLHRLGGGDDIGVGSPVAGRTDQATADMVGLFANMVVLRNDFAGNPTLRTVIRRAREAALGAYSHAGVPIDRLVEAINPARSLSRNPLFQTMVHYREEDWLADGLDLDGTGATRLIALPFDFDLSLLDMSVNFFAAPDGGFAASIIVNRDLYDRATGEALAERLLGVLSAFVTTPDLPVDDLDLLSTPERARILDEWGRGAALPADAVVDADGLMDLISRADDDAPAVCVGDTEFTYRELRWCGDRVADAPSAIDEVAELYATLSDPSRDHLEVEDGAGSRVRVGLSTLVRGVAARVAHYSSQVVDDPRTGDVRVVLATPHTIDHACEVLAALAQSATIVVLEESRRGDPAALVGAVAAHGATRVVAPAPILAAIAQTGVSVMPTVRDWTVLDGAPSPALAQLLSAVADRSVARYVRSVPLIGGAAVIGDIDGAGATPAPGVRVLVLDAAHRPVPPRVDGDIHVVTTDTDGAAPITTGLRGRWTQHGVIRLADAHLDTSAGLIRAGGSASNGELTETERILIALLEALLDVTEVTVDDGFFALGGDSVISVQWAVRANQAGLAMTPQMVFEYFTLGELAAAVDAGEGVDAESNQSAAQEVSDISAAAPMSASGLSDDALASLTSAWKATR